MNDYNINIINFMTKFILIFVKKFEFKFKIIKKQQYTNL